LRVVEPAEIRASQPGRENDGNFGESLAGHSEYSPAFPPLWFRF